MLSMDLAGTHVNAVGGGKTVALGFFSQERRFVVGKITGVANRSAAGARRRHARAIQRLAALGDRSQREDTLRHRRSGANDRLEVDLYQLVGEVLLLQKVQKR